MSEITIWVNGRFLTRRQTGVERVAAGILRGLAENFLDHSGSVTKDGVKLSFKFVLDRKTKAVIPEFAAGWEVRRTGFFSGHLWEQFDLAFFRPGDWLLSLCNTGPVFRKKQALYVHDAQVFAIPENFSLRFRLWYQTMLRLSCRNSAILLTNSRFSAEELARWIKIPAERFRVIYPGSEHMDGLRSVEMPDALSRISDRPFLLAFAADNPNKNFAAVLEALRLLNAGDQTEAPVAVLVGQRNSRVFSGKDFSKDDVIELGFVSDEVLAGLYRRALCLVFPSYYEGFGLPPVEAMRLGCPVVVSRTSSFPEVCGDAALYCEPTDPRTLAAKITEIMNRSTDPAEYRQICVERSSLFNWKNSAEQILDRFSEISLNTSIEKK